jgi:branched-chain amino acid transport system permease protein
MGVVLIWLMHNRPEGLLGHRKETASSVDLARPGTSGSSGRTAAADGGDEQ